MDTGQLTNILITKHGVEFTAEKNSIIITTLKAYQNLLVAKYKIANRVNKGIIIEMGDVDWHEYSTCNNYDYPKT